MLDLPLMFVLIFYIVTLSMSFLEDYLISKLFLRKSPLRKAKIIYFEHYVPIRDHYDFSVVEYEEEKDVIKKVFVRRKKNDKVGDVITVVSNKYISVRPEIYKKMDMRMDVYIIGIIFMVGSILYLKSDFMYMTLQEILIYLLVLLAVFWGYIGLYYASYKIIVHDYFKC